MRFSKRVLSVSSSQTLKLNSMAKKLKSEGKKIIAFTAGEPDFNSPQKAKEAAINAINENLTRYTPVSGIDELLDEIADYETKRLGIRITRENVFVAPGAKYVIYVCLELLIEDGDEVVFLSPYWVSYPEMVRLKGGVPKIIRTKLENLFQPTKEDLKNSVTEKTRVIIINSPNNPTGIIYSAETLNQIAELMREHPELVLISDDIYEGITFGSTRAPSIVSAAPELVSRVFFVNGVSKKFAMTGWRIGWAVCPAEVKELAARILSHTVSCPSSISQHAALGALKLCLDESEKMRLVYEKRKDIIISMLRQIPSISFVEPAGAFYIFVDISNYIGHRFRTCDELIEFLLEKHGVLVVPGEPFGESNFIRLSFALSEQEIIEGCKRLKKALEEI